MNLSTFKRQKCDGNDSRQHPNYLKKLFPDALKSKGAILDTFTQHSSCQRIFNWKSCPLRSYNKLDLILYFFLFCCLNHIIVIHLTKKEEVQGKTKM
jgi:hypothetical protein